MSKNKDDYSDCIAAVSNLSNVRAIMTGFTFIIITLLLIELPDPSQINAQIVLFTLTALVDLFIHTLCGSNGNISFHGKSFTLEIYLFQQYY